MSEQKEQGLVERLLADAKPEPKIDTTLFVSEQRQSELAFGATLPYCGKEDVARAIREAIEETVRTVQRHGNKRLEAQAAENAELRAEVDNCLALLEAAARCIKTEKARAQAAETALATAREALRANFCPRPCNHRPADFEVGPCVDAGECGCMNVQALKTKEHSHG